MSTEQIREEFEKWYGGPRVGDHFIERMLKRLARDAYFDAWGKSRAALVLELPQKCGHLNMHNGHVIPEAASYDEAIDDCAYSIRASGITVKEG